MLQTRDVYIPDGKWLISPSMTRAQYEYNFNFTYSGETQFIWMRVVDLNQINISPSNIFKKLLLSMNKRPNILM